MIDERDGDDQAVEPRRRRPRGRYRVTGLGSSALEAYRARVAEAQAVIGDRAVLEQSQADWAKTHGLGKRDALVLDEVATRPQSVVELLRSLGDCGMPRTAIEEGVDRLTSGGLIEPSPGR